MQTSPPVGAFSSQPPAPPQPAPYTSIAAPPKQSLSLTSFILGIAALVFCWVPVLGFLVSLAAIILGFIGKAREPGAPKWMWLVGIIAGFVGILISLVFVVLLILSAVLAATSGQYSTP